jgi:hypothetical protein
MNVLANGTCRQGARAVDVWECLSKAAPRPSRRTRRTKSIITRQVGGGCNFIARVSSVPPVLVVTKFGELEHDYILDGPGREGLVFCESVRLSLVGPTKREQITYPNAAFQGMSVEPFELQV